MSQMTGPGNDKVLAGIAEGVAGHARFVQEQLSTTQSFTRRSPQSRSHRTESWQDNGNWSDSLLHARPVGDKTKSVDDVAIRFPDGSVLGKPDRIRFRFNTTFMQLASQGKL